MSKEIYELAINIMNLPTLHFKLEFNNSFKEIVKLSNIYSTKQYKPYSWDVGW